VSDAVNEPRYLTAEQARRTYDRIGPIQDLQAIYEHRAIRELLAHADFEHAHAVFELGFGTATLAKRLLERHLPTTPATSAWSSARACIGLPKAACHPSRPVSSCCSAKGRCSCRFPPASSTASSRPTCSTCRAPETSVACSAKHSECSRLGGLLCLTSLTHGQGPPGKLIARAWAWLWSRSPALVGGCRALELSAYLTTEWQLQHSAVVCSIGISSEVLIARRF
jgi:hypothetical protein